MDYYINNFKPRVRGELIKISNKIKKLNLIA